MDGYNREEICKRLGASCQTVEKVFATQEDALAWMEANARGRRNQTRSERNYYLGLRYLREKQGHGGQIPGSRKSEEMEGKKVPLDRTAEALAQQSHCSDRHVKNCGKFAAHLAPH